MYRQLLYRADQGHHARPLFFVICFVIDESQSVQHQARAGHQHHRAWFILGHCPSGQALWLDVSTLTLLIQKSINKTGILTQFFTGLAFSPQLKFRKDSCLICHFNYQRDFPLWEKYLKRHSNYLWIWLIFRHYHATMVHMCLQKWIESLCLMFIVYIFTQYF